MFFNYIINLSMMNAFSNHWIVKDMLYISFIFFLYGNIKMHRTIFL